MADRDAELKEMESEYLCKVIYSWVHRRYERNITYKPELSMLTWAEDVYEQSEGRSFTFLDVIKTSWEDPMPPSLRRSLLGLLDHASLRELEGALRVDTFIKLFENKWPDVVKKLAGKRDVAPSMMCVASNFAKQQFIRMDFGTNDLNCYFMWPSLLQLKDSFELVLQLDKEKELQEMQAACQTLILEQKHLFAKEGDRELKFYEWLNNNFIGGRLSVVIPQVDVGPYNSNGIIFDTEGDEFEANKFWKGFRVTDIVDDLTDDNGLISYTVTTDVTDSKTKEKKRKKLTSKQFFQKSNPLRQTCLNSAWHCVIETKRDDNMLVLAQSGAYYYFHSLPKTWTSNIPMFLLCLTGTNIKFGVAIMTSRTTMCVSELKTFSLQTKFTSTQDNLEMASYFVAFRHLMIEASDFRLRLNGQGVYHVDPISDIVRPLAYDEDFNFPPRRQFSAENEKFEIVGISERFQKKEPDMAKFMYGGVAQRVPVPVGDASLENINVVVRCDCRYGREAHLQLFEAGFAPRLFTAERLHPDYDHVYFIVMERLDVQYRCLHNLIQPKMSLSDESRTYITDRLNTLNEELETRNVVHGDLRTCNIFFRESPLDLKILDFEFGTSAVGIPSYYPCTLNAEVPEEWGCSHKAAALELRGEVITHSQDEKMIKRCISLIKKNNYF